MTGTRTDTSVVPASGDIMTLLVRLEGKIERVIDNQQRQADDVKTVRDRVHAHAQELQLLIGANMPEKLATHGTKLESHESRIASLESDLQQRRGAMSVMRALWAMIGLIGGGGILAIVKLAGGF